MPTFTTPQPIAATVQVAGARVRVTASDRTDTVVLVEPIDKTNRSDVKVADKTKVDFAGGRLSVKTTASGEKAGSVAISIDLPTGSSLVAYLAHSSVDADGSFDECELHTASSRVRLDRVTTLRANIAGGEVEVGRIAGRADIEGGVAEVRIGEVEGADARVSAKTGDGAIRIGRMTRGQAELANSSGTIEVGIGEGAEAIVDAHSKRGAVHDSVAAQGKSDDQVTVHARTRYSDIVIQRAAS